MTALSGDLVRGRFDTRFERVAEVFGRILASDPDHGAALAVTIDGSTVVDVWGGAARPGEPWSESTRCLVWSATKGMAALCVQALVDRGRIDVSGRVAEYWPEFASAGKQSITIEDVLTHRAGLPYWNGYRSTTCLDEPATFADTAAITAAIAAAVPVTRPGEEIAYHAITYGWLLDEIVRRATGRGIAGQFAALVAEPLQLSITLGRSGAGVRPADLAVLPIRWRERLAIIRHNSPKTLAGRAMLYGSRTSALRVDRFANEPAFRESGQAAVAGITDARSLARMYAMLACGGTVDGERHLSQESVRLFSRVHSHGHDLVLKRKVRRGLGYKLNLDGAEFGPPPNAYGHGGLGGSLGFADPDARLGFGFVMNGLDLSADAPPRALDLSKALYESL